MSKSNWKSYLFEFLTIIFSILLAFALNSWNENRKERSTAKDHLESLKQEVKMNLEEVNEKLEYHSNLARLLKENPDSANLVLKLSRLKDYAWQVAESGPLNQYIEDTVYLKFLEVYKIQEALDRHNQDVGELMSYLNVIGPYHALAIPEFEKNAEILELYTKQGWINIFEDTVFYEGLLKKLYTELLEDI